MRREGPSYRQHLKSRFQHCRISHGLLAYQMADIYPGRWVPLDDLLVIHNCVDKQEKLPGCKADYQPIWRNYADNNLFSVIGI